MRITFASLPFLHHCRSDLHHLLSNGQAVQADQREVQVDSYASFSGLL